MRLRAWLTAALTLITLTLTALVPAVLTPPAATADDQARLTVRIDTVSPSRLSRDATITLAGVVRNPGTATWRSVQAYLVIAATPFTTRRQIEEAIENGNSYTGERVVEAGRFDELGDVAPGATVPFRVDVPTSMLGLAGSGGVYPVGVQILATDEDGERSNDAVARATTFLPWVDDPDQPIAAGTVWPFVATWDPARPDPKAIAASVTGGQLRRYLDAAADIPRPGRTLLLDPALPDALTALLPDEDASEAAGEATGLSQAQAEGIRSFLTDLQSLARDSTTWVVDYARPDTLALSRHRQHADQLLETADTATSEVLAAQEITGSRAAWPTIGGATRTMLESIRQRGDVPTVLSRASVPDWEPRLGSVVHVPTRGGPLSVVVNGALPDVPGDDTAATVRQRILTDAALAALAGEADSADRTDALTFIDPRWDPGTDAAGAVLAGAISTEGSGGLTRPVTADDLVRSAPPVYSGSIPTTVDTGALSAGYLDLVAAYDTASSTFASVVTDRDGTQQRRDVAAALSVRWRDHQSVSASRVRTALDAVNRDLNKIRVESPSTITLSGKRGGFPVTISNATSHPVRVGLDLQADRASITIDDVDPVEIAAGERRTVTVETDLSGQSSTTVTARLVSSEGDTFSMPVSFNIRSSNVGLIVWIAMGAAGALLVATWARRFLGHRRVRGE